MSHLLTLALAKAMKGPAVKEASKELPVGEHEIDMLVNVKGTIKRGEDFEQVVHMSVDSWGLLAVALSKLNGVTVKSLAEEAMKAENADKVSEVKANAKEAIEAVKKSLGKQKVNGKVTAKLVATQVVSEGVELEAVEAVEAIEEEVADEVVHG